MNRILFVAALFVCSSSMIYGQSDREALAAQFDKMCQLCNDRTDTIVIEGQKDPRFNKRVAPYFLYIGQDSIRSWTTATRYDSLEDQDLVDTYCDEINGLLNDSTATYEVSDYFSEKEDDLDWHVLEVQFNRAEALPKYFYFAFVRFEENFLLGNIIHD